MLTSVIVSLKERTDGLTNQHKALQGEHTQI